MPVPSAPSAFRELERATGIEPAQRDRLPNGKLYCLLLDTLASQAPELLPWAIEGYFWHIWRGRFPETSSSTATPNTTQAEVLRERLIRALRKAYKEAEEVKESFREDAG
ncbi:MAG: hypothetical protein PHS32_16775 [Rhodoferax sp.]|uniref:hypothetical protein n=1 Tax=Rhodoferax sp. TaxID=50421 RepID=UPI002621EA08|nr:hypothetical protein [Rhodoferax sp.]MDD5335389.1 hypothetical protein [Rhodoferax sp.]